MSPTIRAHKEKPREDIFSTGKSAKFASAQDVCEDGLHESLIEAHISNNQGSTLIAEEEKQWVQKMQKNMELSNFVG